jgi:organic radical activating enzyme
MHNFKAKLSDPGVVPLVRDYVAAARRRRGSAPELEGLRGESPSQGPVSVNLDLTLACDYRCGHCIDAELLNGGRHLEMKTVLGTLDLLTRKGLRSVILIGGGEPTLYPYFEDVVIEIKRLGLECAIVSNGARNEKIARIAPHLGPNDWVRLSLDAGTDETFQTLHRPRKPVTLEHICKTAAQMKDQAPRLQLGFSFIVMWSSPGQALTPVVSNVHEMALAAKLAKEHRFDYISFKPMLVRNSERAEVVNIGRTQQESKTPSGHDKAVADQISACLREAQRHADDSFKIVPSRNLWAMLDGSALERNALQPKECHMQQFRQVVAPGGIFACPAHRGNQRSRLSDHSGYSTPESLEETSKATGMQILSFDASTECREITCIYNDANWWFEDLIKSGETLQPMTASDFFL